ncbi:hypothetical protein Y032_0093g2674 [Ancylostoma ceylanicum]|nr:hypothetical protein Y032_0093g2674 [Ancylostoma ceylanicum]
MFRAHPTLNEQPKKCFYIESLIGGNKERDRCLLLDIIRFPRHRTLFAFVDVEESSVNSASHSHSNVAEIRVCRTLVGFLLNAGIGTESIFIITFYKEQHRQLEEYARSVGVGLSIAEAT